MGCGYGATIHSLLTYLVVDDQISLLFTVVAVFDGLAVMIFSPLLQISFSCGLGVGGLAVSTPFFLVAALYTIAASGLLFCSFQ